MGNVGIQGVLQAECGKGGIHPKLRGAVVRRKGHRLQPGFPLLLQETQLFALGNIAQGIGFFGEVHVGGVVVPGGPEVGFRVDAQTAGQALQAIEARALGQGIQSGVHAVQICLMHRIGDVVILVCV